MSATHKTLALPDPAATRALAGRLAALARPGDVIALQGDLGTGKTVLARAFVRARAGHDEEVPSPTFTLVQTYDLPGGRIWHFDLYRLVDPEEAWELDIEDAFADGISLIEWPDRLGDLLPGRALVVTLEHGGRGDQDGHGGHDGHDGPGARTAILDGGPDWTPRLKEAGLV